MNPTILSILNLILSLIALAAAATGWWSLRSFNRLRKTFFASSGHEDLEQVINTLVRNYNALQEHQSVLEKNLVQLQNNSNLAVQKVGIVRFNPFADGGGNFSFSIALLNGHNTGTVITSMHGREQNRIYTKKIQEGKSENQLTEEESRAVEQAVATHRNQFV